MRIRCGMCHGSVWIQATDGAGDRAIVKCRSCSQEYDLRSTLRKLDLDAFLADAREFAQNSGIDLPAAYSVLLGITTLDQIRDLYGPSSRSVTPVKYDASFAEAVKAGWLTPEQAAMRGKRQLFAERLVQRHGLSMKKALQVADNRVPLLAAVRQGGPTERIEVRLEKRRRPVWSIAIAAGMAIAAAALVWLFVVPDVDEGPTVRASVPKPDRLIAALDDLKTDVRHNPRGELVQISGRDPEAILREYCKYVRGGHVDPAVLNRSGDDWTGLYWRDGELFSITIRHDASRDLWVLGNAVDRIHTEPVAGP